MLVLGNLGKNDNRAELVIDSKRSGIPANAEWFDPLTGEKISDRGNLIVPAQNFKLIGIR